MDLRLGAAVPSDIERAVIDAFAGGRRPRRDELLPALHAVHDRCGYLGDGALNHLAEVFDVAPAEIYGVASFYDLFGFVPTPAVTVRRCIDISCVLAGVPERADGDQRALIGGGVGTESASSAYEGRCSDATKAAATSVPSAAPPIVIGTPTRDAISPPTVAPIDQNKRNASW